MKKSIMNIRVFVAFIFVLIMSFSLVACGAVGTESASDTSYGKADWSTAAQGYIIFTAKGHERCFILQGPDSSNMILNVQDNETVKISLTDGAGDYQYAIADRGPGENSCKILYKNSFTIRETDADFVF